MSAQLAGVDLPTAMGGTWTPAMDAEPVTCGEVVDTILNRLDGGNNGTSRRRMVVDLCDQSMDEMK